jgi:hypothetical protein
VEEEKGIYLKLLLYLIVIIANLKLAEPVIMTDTPITITTHTIQIPVGEPTLALTYNNIYTPIQIEDEDEWVDKISLLFILLMIIALYIAVVRIYTVK